MQARRTAGADKVPVRCHEAAAFRANAAAGVVAAAVMALVAAAVVAETKSILL
jgi:hypothetical protein